MIWPSLGDLSAFRDEADSLIEGARSSSRAPLSQCAPAYEEASRFLRAKAILELLLNADRATFFTDLVRSGEARRDFLGRASREHFDSYLLAASRSEGLLDAIAASAGAVARDIALASPTLPRLEDEYEEEFCHARFLGLLVSGATTSEQEHVLGRFEACLDGEANSRLEVDRALLARSAQDFGPAFDRLLELRASELEASMHVDEDPADAADARVFIEGLALVRLAQALGLPVRSGYRMLPRLVLIPPNSNLLLIS